MTLDYKGQPRDKGGRFTYGKLGKGSTQKNKNGKIRAGKIGKAEYKRVSSQIFTDFPKLKPGSTMYNYCNGNHFYRFSVNGPGSYTFHMKLSLRGNQAYINWLSSQSGVIL